MFLHPNHSLACFFQKTLNSRCWMEHLPTNLQRFGFRISGWYFSVSYRRIQLECLFHISTICHLLYPGCICITAGTSRSNTIQLPCGQCVTVNRHISLELETSFCSYSLLSFNSPFSFHKDAITCYSICKTFYSNLTEYITYYIN